LCAHQKLNEIAPFVAFNAEPRHVQERPQLARTIVGTTDLRLTEENLAQMLGVQYASVSMKTLKLNAPTGS